MRSHFLTFKIIAILLLIAIFWVGLAFINTLVSERQGYQQEFIQDISSTQINPQIIIAPYIRVPYEDPQPTTCINDKNEKYACTQTHWQLIGAESTHWTSNFAISDQDYVRSIYRAISYHTDLKAKGVFQKEQLENKPYQWDKAEIILPIHDPRGLDAQPSLQILNKNYAFTMSQSGVDSSGFDFMRITAKEHPEMITAIQNGFAFNLNVNTSGLGKFTLVPTSHLFTYNAQGNWADIKYDGQSLPKDNISEPEKFTAQWKNIALGQQNLNKLAACENNDCLRQFTNSSYSREGYEGTPAIDKIGLSTEFLESVNVYTLTDRAIKYGIVIIIISFGCFFLFEVLKNLRIHPIQYSLVAMAQGIFFVLLLSISEYYAFAWAYMVAALACVMLMSWYLYFVMKGIKAAALFAVILSALYSMMYMLLQSSGKTFLMGSVISFVVLAVVMFITRNIDWYQIGVKPKSELQNYPPSQN